MAARAGSPRVAIYDPGINNQTIGNVLVVTPNGILVNLFTELDAAGASFTASLGVIRSMDNGATWSAPIHVADLLTVGTSDPDTGAPVRDSALLAEMAVAPDGSLDVVWQDSRFTSGAHDSIALSRSADGGLTWSAPVRVNSSASVPAFSPMVHVRGDGAIGVTYYDFRANTSDRSTLLTDYWLARSARWRELAGNTGRSAVRSHAGAADQHARRRRLFSRRLSGPRQRRQRVRSAVRAHERRHVEPDRHLPRATGFGFRVRGGDGGGEGGRSDVCRGRRRRDRDAGARRARAPEHRRLDGSAHPGLGRGDQRTQGCITALTRVDALGKIAAPPICDNPAMTRAIGGERAPPHTYHHLFFALWPDADVRARIEAAAQILKSEHAPLGRWIKPHRYHLTLRYLGEHASLPESLVAAALAAGDDVRAPSFDVVLDVAGSFANRKIPWWLGCAGVANGLTALWEAIVAGLDAQGPSAAR